MSEQRDREQKTQPDGRAPVSDMPRIFQSADMFAGGKEVIIEHQGTTYRLRHTSQGKLILTK